MEVIKVTPRGYCKGVTRAIALAKQTATTYPDKPIYVLGMLVHNTYVMQALKELHIIAIDDKKKTRMELLDEISEGVVIFTAHGVSPSVIQKAAKKGLICVDASCPDVMRTQMIVTDKLAQGYEVLYVGKYAHPEAEAICSLDKHVHLITKKEDVDFITPADKLFVTNQTTMSIFDIEHIFAYIKVKFPKTEFSEEICNATRIRQQAVAALKNENIDTLYVVGDRFSNNSNRLAQIAREQGISHVFLIDDVAGIRHEQLQNAQRVAVTSGASTPTYLTHQVIAYLENYASDAQKPRIEISKIL